MKWLHQFRNGLTTVETWLAGASLLGLVIISFAQILIRNLLDTGIPGLEESARHLVLYVMFFGAVLAVENSHHIKIDVFNAWQAGRRSVLLPKILYLIGTAVTAALTLAALSFWQDEWQYANAGQRWQVLLNGILPLGFGLLALHFLMALIIGPQSGHRRS